MALIRCLLTVTGRVQGVGFRYSACAEARRLGLTGWVRNESDGRVALDVEGDAEAVASFKAWCRHGPRAARVDGVDGAEAPLAGYKEFRIAF